MDNDPGGWAVFFACYLVFWLSLNASDRKPILLGAGFLVLTAHFVVSYWNVMYGPLVFAKTDATGFHVYAKKVVELGVSPEWTIGTSFYHSILQGLYHWFGVSLWLGQGLSILLFSISVGSIVRIANHMEITNEKLVALAVLGYGLIPSVLMYGSITIREPFMTAFLMLGCEFALRGIQTGRGIQIACAIGFWILMGLFHQVVMGYAFFLSFMLIVTYQWRHWHKNMGLYRFLPFLLLAAVAVILFYALAPTGGDDYHAMLFFSVPESLSHYREVIQSTSPTTTYAKEFSFSTWPGLFLSLPQAYLYYLGWPITGDYQSVWVWVVAADAIVRLGGIFAGLILIKERKLWCLFFVFITLSFLWSNGTTNYGQALRHHMMTDWIMIITFIYFVQCRLRLGRQSE